MLKGEDNIFLRNLPGNLPPAPWRTKIIKHSGVEIITQICDYNGEPICEISNRHALAPAAITAVENYPRVVAALLEYAALQHMNTGKPNPELDQLIGELTTITYQKDNVSQTTEAEERLLPD